MILLTIPQRNVSVVKKINKFSVRGPDRNNIYIVHPNKYQRKIIYWPFPPEC